ncbi:MAG: 4-hydroxy-3-methylbut-2-enyl diphosphate reductase [Myxococcota bacterium]|nr:4-hydroxy-3-methylbut-2-enyl diphosphate reductase [Myxococcota bacterium]
MQLVLADARGFCAGVDRAIEIVERALARFGPPVYVRHEIVHNQHVVEELRRAGAVFIEDPADVPEDAILVFSAHGVSPAIVAAAEGRDLRIIDATCPLVTKVHKQARRFARQDHEIIMVGHAGHVEVEGTMGQAPERMHLVENVADVAALEVADPERLACVTQTTLSVDDTREVLEALRTRFPAIQLPKSDDICYATQNRQDAIKRLAEDADVVLVIGSPASSNSNRLVEVARKCGADAHLIQDASELDATRLAGAEQVAVTAGASTPELLVQGVVERVRELSPGVQVDSPAELDEGMTFPLPPLLR